MTIFKYILKNGKVVVCNDLLKWGKWFETADRIIQQDKIKVGKKEKFISTVFLGLDHNYSDGTPLLFETMVFDSTKGTVQYGSGEVVGRYATKAQALKGHEKIVRNIKGLTH